MRYVETIRLNRRRLPHWEVEHGRYFVTVRCARIRKLLPGRGPLWQGEWFDRWVRNDTELERMIAYIQNNPVKAGLAPTWQQHPWTR